MDIKTYLDKTNTIIYNSKINTGQNPICELCYGDGYTRVLIHFDANKIQNLVNDKTFSDKTKIKHILKLTNCWQLQPIYQNIVFNANNSTTKERTSSFDIELIKMEEEWDAGIGNDFTSDGLNNKNYIISENGSNWYNAKSNIPWIMGNGGISGETNVIATQHFDLGNENIEIDITEEVNSIIFSGQTNFGYMIKFPNLFEQTKTQNLQYVGFITNNSYSIYMPYLETIYNENIIDDRNEFYLNKTNKLYLYTLIKGEYDNLDVMPTCDISGVQYPVKQATKGVYYVEINADEELFNEGDMYYDVWSNIIYKGKHFINIEQDFVVKPQEDFFQFSNINEESEKYIPNVYGINYGDKLNSGDARKIYINPRLEYSTKKIKYITGIEYRIYFKDSRNEVDIINYQPVNRTHNSNYFILDTESLLPNKYFIDVKIKRNDEIITYKEKLMFEVVNQA